MKNTAACISKWAKGTCQADFSSKHFSSPPDFAFNPPPLAAPTSIPEAVNAIKRKENGDQWTNELTSWKLQASEWKVINGNNGNLRVFRFARQWQFCTIKKNYREIVFHDIFLQFEESFLRIPWIIFLDKIVLQDGNNVFPLK